MEEQSIAMIENQIGRSIAIIQIDVFDEQPNEKTVQIDNEQSVKHDVNNKRLQKSWNSDRCAWRIYDCTNHAEHN